MGRPASTASTQVGKPQNIHVILEDISGAANWSVTVINSTAAAAKAWVHAGSDWWAERLPPINRSYPNRQFCRAIEF
jgi:hypothetical protein